MNSIDIMTHARAAVNAEMQYQEQSRLRVAALQERMRTAGLPPTLAIPARMAAALCHLSSKYPPPPGAPRKQVRERSMSVFDLGDEEGAPAPVALLAPAFDRAGASCAPTDGCKCGEAGCRANVNARPMKMPRVTHVNRPASAGSVTEDEASMHAEDVEDDEALEAYEAAREVLAAGGSGGRALGCFPTE